MYVQIQRKPVRKHERFNHEDIGDADFHCSHRIGAYSPTPPKGCSPYTAHGVYLIQISCCLWGLCLDFEA